MASDLGCEPYRRELHLHCFRLLGSLHGAEDVVQETMLRAWQRFDTFKGAASLRTWLYTMATNACLDALKKRPPRTLPVAAYSALDPLSPIASALAEAIWLEPFPDSWLIEAADNPEAHYTRRESDSLAFLTVLQQLPPRQRAILLLSNVLDWRASEEAIRAILTSKLFGSGVQKKWRLSPTGANAQPTFAIYRADESKSSYRAFGIQVVTLDRSALARPIAAVTIFNNPPLVISFGFPLQLPG